MVLSQDQVNGSAFWRAIGEDCWSAGSSYTGQTTRASLQCVCRFRLSGEGRNKRSVLCVRENRPALVEEVVDAELDSTLHHPAERAVVVVHCVVDEKRIVESERLEWVGWCRNLGR